MRPTRLWPILAVTWLAGCTSEDSPRTSNRGAYPIVGGTAETGYPGVGALVIRRGAGTALCTGTKIGDGWVLTAAHCVVSSTAADVQFFDGPDVSGAGGWHPARTLHVHPLYVPGDPPGGVPTQNAVALVEVTGIGALPTYETAASPAGLAPGLAVTWVGYGLNRVAPDSGDGLKRRGAGHLSGIYWTQLVYTTSRQRCRAAATRAGRCSRRSAVASGSSASSRPERRGLRRRRHHRLCGSTFAGWIADVMAGGGTGSCDPTGGDCSVGACLRCERPLLCVPTGGDAVGGTCEPDGTSWSVTVPCADGAVCLAASSAPGDGRLSCDVPRRRRLRDRGDVLPSRLPRHPGRRLLLDHPRLVRHRRRGLPDGAGLLPRFDDHLSLLPQRRHRRRRGVPAGPLHLDRHSLRRRPGLRDADRGFQPLRPRLPRRCGLRRRRGLPHPDLRRHPGDRSVPAVHRCRCRRLLCRRRLQRPSQRHLPGRRRAVRQRPRRRLRRRDRRGMRRRGCRRRRRGGRRRGGRGGGRDGRRRRRGSRRRRGRRWRGWGAGRWGRRRVRFRRARGGRRRGMRMPGAGKPPLRSAGLPAGRGGSCGACAGGGSAVGPGGLPLGRDRPPTSGPDPFGASSRAPTQHEQQQSSYQTGRETNTGPSQQLDWPAQTRTTVGPQPQPPSVPVTTGSSHVLAEPLSVCSRVFFGPFVDLLGGFAALLVVLLVRFFMIHLQRPHPPVRPAEPMSVRIRRRQPERWRDEAGEVGISSSSSGSRGWGS